MTDEKKPEGKKSSKTGEILRNVLIFIFMAALITLVVYAYLRR